MSWESYVIREALKLGSLHSVCQHFISVKSYTTKPKLYTCSIIIVCQNLGSEQELDLKEALIRLKPVRIKLKPEQYCFCLKHFKVSVLALK